MARFVDLGEHAGMRVMDVGGVHYFRAYDLVSQKIPDHLFRSAYSYLFAKATPAAVKKKRGVHRGWYFPVAQAEAFANHLNDADVFRQVRALVFSGIKRRKTAATEKLKEIIMPTFKFLRTSSQGFAIYLLEDKTIHASIRLAHRPEGVFVCASDVINAYHPSSASNTDHFMLTLPCKVPEGHVTKLSFFRSHQYAFHESLLPAVLDRVAHGTDASEETARAITSGIAHALTLMPALPVVEREEPAVEATESVESLINELAAAEEAHDYTIMRRELLELRELVTVMRAELDERRKADDAVADLKRTMEGFALDQKRLISHVLKQDKAEKAVGRGVFGFFGRRSA